MCIAGVFLKICCLATVLDYHELHGLELYGPLLWTFERHLRNKPNIPKRHNIHIKQVFSVTEMVFFHQLGAIIENSRSVAVYYPVI